MPSPSYRKLFWSLVVVGFTLDLGSKYGMFRTLWSISTPMTENLRQGSIEVVPGAFRFIAQYHMKAQPADGDWRAPLQRLNSPDLPRVNQGALFGMGDDYQRYGNGFFMVVSLLAGIAITIWSRTAKAGADRTLCIALGMILGGTLGNLFDRIVFHGVRDFLYFYWFEWPVFNIADCLLVCGAGLLLLQAFFTSPDKKKEPATQIATPELAATK
jgi:signal peptidase II